MSIQLVLLFVELFLLVATLALLLLSRRESRSREMMMRHFTSVADVITRQEYFVAVVDTIQKAEESLVASVTGSPPAPEESEVIEQILKALKDASERGVSIRYLLPLSPDRLQMAKKYRSIGADVRLHPSLPFSDVRYTVADGKITLIGVPAKKGKKEPTRKGYSIPSESVAQMFKTQFESLWNSPESKDYDAYLKELVSQAVSSNPNISAELLAGNLGLDSEDIQKTLASLRR
ncbi:MAG: TrmB family transcriptional regulator sugar-binding domain-containing protein [Conexivisphaerales archaeon]